MRWSQRSLSIEIGCAVKKAYRARKRRKGLLNLKLNEKIKNNLISNKKACKQTLKKTISCGILFQQTSNGSRRELSLFDSGHERFYNNNNIKKGLELQ